MKKTLLLITFIVCLLLFYSCATINIGSNKDAGYTQKPSKIYIIVTGTNQTPIFCEELFDGLKTEFNTRHISCDGLLRDQLSLETESEVAKKVENFTPDAVLSIKETRVTYQRTTISSIKFEILLIDEQTKRPVWKAIMDVTNLGFAGGEDDTVKKLIKKMQTDKLI